MRWILLGAALAAVALFAVGFVVFGSGSDVAGGVEDFIHVNERRGEYRGVVMGDSSEEVRRALGEDAGGSGFAPAGTSPAEAGVPALVAAPRGRKPELLKYEDAAFLVGPRGVYAFIVTEDGARTARDVAIGDNLEEARERYDLQCSRVAGGESLVGEDTSTYPSCSTTLPGGMRIWFGRDPIASVTLLSLAHLGSR